MASLKKNAGQENQPSPAKRPRWV